VTPLRNTHSSYFENKTCLQLLQQTTLATGESFLQSSTLQQASSPASTGLAAGRQRQK
jgi:hypothetical protein